MRKIYSFYNPSVCGGMCRGGVAMPWFVPLRTKPFKPFFGLLILLLLLCFNASATDIYVSINGSDTNLGTKEKPLATLHAAIRKVRELRRLNDASIKGGIRIIMGKGFYQLHEPIVFRPEGVQPTSPGYENYAIEPNLGGLAWMEGKVPTTNGDISVFAVKKKLRFRRQQE
nr:hypothetical protein [uncultured Pedobacter sp.]